MKDSCTTSQHNTTTHRLVTTESVLWYGNRGVAESGRMVLKIGGRCEICPQTGGRWEVKATLSAHFFKVKSCYIVLAIYIYSNIKLTAKMLLDEIEGNVEINTLMFTKLDLAGRGETLKCQNLSLINEFRGN